MPQIEKRKAGQPKAYTPEEFEKKIYEYKDHCRANPWRKKVWVGKDGREEYEETERPMTIEGFIVFADISFQTWYNYKSAKGYDQYFEIVSRGETLFRSQNLEGGMVGAYNANLVARYNSIKEKTENETTIKVGKELADEQYASMFDK